MTRSTVFCLTLVLLLLQACQGFEGCGDAERSEGHAVRPDDTAPDRANREGACLRRAAGLTVRRLRRANTWARSPAGPPPELPTVEDMPEGAGAIPVGTDALETIQLSLGPETVHLGEHLVHEREQKGAYTPDEIEAFGSTLQERWGELTDSGRRLDRPPPRSRRAPRRPAWPTPSRRTSGTGSPAPGIVPGESPVRCPGSRRLPTWTTRSWAR